MYKSQSRDRRRTHFLFLVRHGERADQKETKVAFRGSGLPQHDPPLRSAFANFLNSSQRANVAEAHDGKKKKGVEAHAQDITDNACARNNSPLLRTSPLEDTSGDAVLDKASNIIFQYLHSRQAIEEVIGVSRGGEGNGTTAAEESELSAGLRARVPQVLMGTRLVTSPLQRCVTTLAHISDRLSSLSVTLPSSSMDSLSPREAVVESDLSHKSLICDSRLFEYLSAGLFAEPKRVIGTSTKKPSRGESLGLGNSSEKLPDTSASDCGRDQSKTSPENTCPIPYVYTESIERGNVKVNDNELPSRSEDKSDSKSHTRLALPYIDRCVFMHPKNHFAETMGTREEKESPVGPTCIKDHLGRAEPFSDKVAESALTYIRNRFPESKQEAEGRFEDFIDDYISDLVNSEGSRWEASSSKHAQAANNLPAITTSIICTHQFGVTAMLNHLLRLRINTCVEHVSVGDGGRAVQSNSLADDGDTKGDRNNSTTISKSNWRKLASDVWIPALGGALAKNSAKLAGDRNLINPQFTTRIDVGSVTLLAIHWNAPPERSVAENTECIGDDRHPPIEVVCTPVTVGEI